MIAIYDVRHARYKNIAACQDDQDDPEISGEAKNRLKTLLGDSFFLLHILDSYHRSSDSSRKKKRERRVCPTKCYKNISFHFNRVFCNIKKTRGGKMSDKRLKTT